jgi:phosphoribosylaminoimidazole (AIR) synthetase
VRNHDELKVWLAANGYDVFETLVGDVGWEACKVVGPEGVRPCALRGKPPKVYVTPVRSKMRSTATVHMTGECLDLMVNPRVTPDGLDDLVEKHDWIVSQLVRMWNSIDTSKETS